jgi:hypothetical protein
LISLSLSGWLSRGFVSPFHLILAFRPCFAALRSSVVRGLCGLSLLCPAAYMAAYCPQKKSRLRPAGIPVQLPVQLPVQHPTRPKTGHFRIQLKRPPPPLFRAVVARAYTTPWGSLLPTLHPRVPSPLSLLLSPLLTELVGPSPRAHPQPCAKSATPCLRMCLSASSSSASPLAFAASSGSPR